MGSKTISDLSIAAPSDALSETPLPNKWLILPYQGDDVAGKMLWCPSRSQPPDVALPLPPLGLCRIYIGLYGSGTVPIWFNLFGPKPGTKSWHRLHLRLSGDDWFDVMAPTDYPDEPRLGYVSETLWRTADVSGQALILSRARKEAFTDTMACIAYVRLVPAASTEVWPVETKRLFAYYDSNFYGHYVDSAQDVKSLLVPLRESDVSTVLWTTCREDTCYYPTRVGNMLPYTGADGVYPYWAGRDLRRMLERGEDPLRVACDVAHACGLRLFASYRRMTCRMPPFVFPLHPEALFVKRGDLWCADAQGEPVPHLSLAYPEVRQRMVALLAEQAENYDIDGIHLFFCRGVPFVFFERQFVEAFRREHGSDPRELPQDDPRVWSVRARFVLGLLHELRAALTRVEERRGKHFPISLHVMNSLRSCAFYGLDIEAIARERLADILLPSHSHYLPEGMGEWRCGAEQVREFVCAARGTGVRVVPECSQGYWEDALTISQRAASFYDAGADGLNVSPNVPEKSQAAVLSRLGHADELRQPGSDSGEAARMVRIRTVAGLRFDLHFGTATCG